MNRKGQFFLIAAIIIIGILIGFATYKNFSKTSVTNTDKVYYLQNELGFEGGKIVDFGIVSGGGDIRTIMKSFTQEYSTYAGEQKSLYFVFGSAGNIYVSGWQDIIAGTVNVNIGNAGAGVDIHRRVYTDPQFQTSGAAGDLVDVVINRGLANEQKRTFKLKEGQNFYFVIQQNVGNEIIVVDSEQKNAKDNE